MSDKTILPYRTPAPSGEPSPVAWAIGWAALLPSRGVAGVFVGGFYGWMRPNLLVLGGLLLTGLLMGLFGRHATDGRSKPALAAVTLCMGTMAVWLAAILTAVY